MPSLTPTSKSKNSGNMPTSLASKLPRLSTILALTLSVCLHRGTIPLPSSLRLFLLVILALNWRNLPTVWHFKVWTQVPVFWLMTKVDKALARGRRVEDGGRFSGVGRHVFDEARVTIEGDCGFDRIDWNLHMSNTSYAVIADFARSAFNFRILGPCVWFDGVYAVLGGTTLAFFREIPMFSSWEAEVKIVTWDEKWAYFLITFTTPASNSPSLAKSQITDKTSGRRRTINAFSLYKMNFRSSRPGTGSTKVGVLRPDRVLCMAGIQGGGTRAKTSNWENAKKLRGLERGGEDAQSKKSRWNDLLKFYAGEGSTDIGFGNEVADQRKKAFELLEKLGTGTLGVWKELAGLD